MEAYVDDGSLTADMIEMPFIHIFTNSCGSSYTRAWNGALSKCRRKEGPVVEEKFTEPLLRAKDEPSSLPPKGGSWVRVPEIAVTLKQWLGECIII